MRDIWFCAVSAFMLAGCGTSVNGVDQAGKTALDVDRYGCPDLAGSYAFSVPGDKGVTYRDSLLEKLEVGQQAWMPASEIRGLLVKRTAPGRFQLRFLVDDAQVLKELQIIREFEKPRYREWYHLLRDPERAADIARSGEATHAKRVGSLGPLVEIERELEVGKDVACSGGWLELPRVHGGPIRLTLGEDRSILGQSRELNMFEISVWCGDGCKYLGVPTSTYTGTLRWPRDESQQPWQASALSANGFERPIEEIEAEVTAQIQSDTLHYLTAAEIRARIEALASEGTTIEKVEVTDGKVQVSVTAQTTTAVDILLGRITDLGGGSAAGGPQAVQRTRTFSSPRDLPGARFVLTDSPLARRPPANMAEAGASSTMESAPSDPAAPMLKLYPALAAAGFADPSIIQERIGALFPPGCRITDVSYDGGRVTIAGQAGSRRCVSEGLRAIDSQGGGPELIDLAGASGEGFTFHILLATSALTRR
ncbi:MAG: PilN domain-containing protein [Pseudoxanthomonas sp.]